MDPRGCDRVPAGCCPGLDSTPPRPPPCCKTWPAGRWLSEFEPVACLEAPEPAELPRSLLRADGRSVYQRHGGARYAPRAQLVMEERMLTQARATNAPRLTHAHAAHALGADPKQLDAALAGRATPRRTRARGPGCAPTRPPRRCRS